MRKLKRQKNGIFRQNISYRTTISQVGNWKKHPPPSGENKENSCTNEKRAAANTIRKKMGYDQ